MSNERKPASAEVLYGAVEREHHEQSEEMEKIEKILSEGGMTSSEAEDFYIRSGYITLEDYPKGVEK